MKGDDIEFDDTMHVTMNKLDDSDDDRRSPSNGLSDKRLQYIRCG